jgi:hypothetical protein
MAAAGPAAAFAATDTWTGAAASDSHWSNATNWTGGNAPPVNGDSLSFPILNSSACTAMPQTATCYHNLNDISSLSIAGMTIDAGATYNLGGNGIALGSGGLTTTASSGFGHSSIGMSLSLSAPQTWTIDGNGNHGTQLNLTGPGTVTGSSTLGIALNDIAFLGVDNAMDVGPLSITGGSMANTGLGALQNGTLSIFNGSLNATHGSPVSLTDASLFSTSGTVGGPFTTSGANLQVGQGGGPGDMLTFNDSVTLDPATSVMIFLEPGTTAGTNYSQIVGTNANKPLNLAGAQLTLIEGNGSCSELHPGDMDTIVTTAGPLTGTFAGVPDGAIVNVGCQGTSPQSVLIHYTANSVTATVIGTQASSSTSLQAPSSATTGQSVNLTATVTPSSGSGPTPTGTVTFLDATTGVALCNSVALTNGSVTCSASFSTAGSHGIVVNYHGDANYKSSATSAAVNVTAASSGGGGTTSTTSTTTTTTTVINSPTPPTAAQIQAALTAAQANFVAQAGTFTTQGLAQQSSLTYTVTALTPGKYLITITFLVQGKATGAAAKRITLGTATATVSAPGIVKIKIKLSRKGRAALRKAAKARLTITTTFTPTGGTPQKVQSTITIRAKKKAKKKK